MEPGLVAHLFMPAIFIIVVVMYLLATVTRSFRLRHEERRRQRIRQSPLFMLLAAQLAAQAWRDGVPDSVAGVLLEPVSQSLEMGWGLRNIGLTSIEYQRWQVQAESAQLTKL